MKTPAAGRVLMLLENSTYIGDTRVSQEAKTLTSAGYKVSVICPRREQRPWRETVDGVHVYRYPRPPRGDSFLGYIWEYGYAMMAIFLLSLVVLVREGFDVVHAHSPPDAIGLVAACYKLLGKRYVYDHHDLSPELYNARFRGSGNRHVYRVLVWLEKLSCRLADHVIATNESYKTVEMQRGHVPEERITIVRNGPDLNSVRPVDPSPALRRKGKTILSYAGVMGTQDGVDYMLRALQHLVYELGKTDLFCFLVGKGSAVPRLKPLTEQLGLSDYVLFTGWVSKAEVARYISAADICVAPEPSDAYNDRSTAIKVMEYMSFGKPIVAFDLPEHRVTAQDAAVYARANDELDFARQIAMLMDDPARCQSMGQIGRNRIEEDLAWPYQGKHLLAAYKVLCTE
jgi:glycosyltransferase involved in cell wall biosynthesis